MIGDIMMNDVLISIIVPLYNGQKWIRRTVQSFFQQDLSSEWYEVIIVDDCSTDNRVAYMIKELQNDYSSLRFICHDRNKRQGAARNTGISIARGKYVMFCDQDDYFHPNVLSRISDRLLESDLDVLVYGTTYEVLDENQNVIVHYTPHYSESVMDGAMFFARNVCSWVPWNKVYRREFLIKKGISFPENRQNGEDILFSLRAIVEAKNVSYLPLYCVCNAYNKDSVTRKGYSLVNVYNDIRTLQDVISYAKLTVKDYPETRLNFRLYIIALLKYIMVAGRSLFFLERCKIFYHLLSIIFSSYLFLTDRRILCCINRMAIGLLLKGRKFRF